MDVSVTVALRVLGWAIEREVEWMLALAQSVLGQQTVLPAAQLGSLCQEQNYKHAAARCVATVTNDVCAIRELLDI